LIFSHKYAGFIVGCPVLLSVALANGGTGKSGTKDASPDAGAKRLHTAPLSDNCWTILDGDCGSSFEYQCDSDWQGNGEGSHAEKRYQAVPDTSCALSRKPNPNYDPAHSVNEAQFIYFSCCPSVLCVRHSEDDSDGCENIPRASKARPRSYSCPKDTQAPAEGCKLTNPNGATADYCCP
jgi:hypothetical protein